MKKLMQINFFRETFLPGKVKLFLTLMALLCMQSFAGAQERKVSGQVLSEDGLSLPGVSIVVKGTTNGTASDIDGNYSILAGSDDVLVFSFIGFITQEILVSGQSEINAVLVEDTEQLDEIVVVGYGTQTRSQMTTSISKLDTKVLESAPRSNAATALQGTIAGLKVTQTSGQPGSTPNIVVRGGTSFEGVGDPLVLIDGVPGSFYALNSDDIESMEVLKDAASTAIYGARAANGVVLVTTKKGKAGKSHINFRSKFTSNYRRSDPMDYLGAADYVKFNRMAVKNAQDVMGYAWLNQFLTGGQAAGVGNNATNSIYTTMVLSDDNRYLLNHEGWQSIEDPVNPGTMLLFQENQMNELFYQNSHAQDYSLSFDGGNEKGTYYLGLGMMDDTGLAFGSSFKRYSGTFNASYKLTEALKVSSNIIYSHSNKNKPFDTEYNLFQRTAGLAPTSRIYNNNPDGSLSDEYQPGTYKGFGNPLYYRDKFVRYNLEQRLTASVQLDYKFLNDFTLTVRGSHFSINDSDEAFNKAYLSSGRLNTERKSTVSHERILRNQVTAMINYTKRFQDKHNVTALLGTEYFEEESFKFKASTRFSPTDLIYTMNVGSEAASVPTSFNTGYKISSLFGRLNYDFDYKYLFGFTFRYDGTSRLGNNQYGFFPGVSAGWNLHKEEFYKDSKWSEIVNKVKPRLSYGVNGNIEVLTNFGVFGTYGKISKNRNVTSIYDTQSGYANTKVPLLDLMWERSTTFNMGLDLGFFNNRVSVIADYFVRDVKDKLSKLNLPLWTGFEYIINNNGTLQNRGFELQINTDVIKKDDLTWNIGLTYYSVRNYAKSLPANGVDKNRQGGDKIYDPATGGSKYVRGLQEGKRVGHDVITAYVFDGVYQTQADIDEHAGRIVEFAYKGDTRFLGDTRWKDLNGDNVINKLDRVVIGRTTPKFTGGITSSLRYKNFDLFVKTDFAVGHYLINGRRVKGIAQTQGNQNGPLEIRDSWTPENPTSNIPIFTLTDRQHNHLAGGWDQGSINSSSSRMWEKGDYLALREVTLSYNIDGKMLNSVFENMRLYVTGTNLAYLNNFSGSSPEEALFNPDIENRRGLDMGRFPLPRTLTFGVNVSF